MRPRISCNFKLKLYTEYSILYTRRTSQNREAAAILSPFSGANDNFSICDCSRVLDASGANSQVLFLVEHVVKKIPHFRRKYYIYRNMRPIRGIWHGNILRNHFYIWLFKLHKISCNLAFRNRKLRLIPLIRRIFYIYIKCGCCGVKLWHELEKCGIVKYLTSCNLLCYNRKKDK